MVQPQQIKLRKSYALPALTYSRTRLLCFSLFTCEIRQSYLTYIELLIKLQEMFVKVSRSLNVFLENFAIIEPKCFIYGINNEITW